MADRYWVGGTATWDTTVGTKWSATSGGTGGASVPTAADNVFFDANSGTGTITVSGTRPCLSLNTTGFTGTLAGTATPVLQVNADLIIGSSTTIAGTLTTIQLQGAAGSRTVTTNGRTLVSITFNSTSGVTWTLQDALTATSTVTLSAGTLSLDSYTLTAGLFFASGTSARTLAFGTGKIVVTGSGVAWNTTTTTSLTITGTNRIVEPTLTAAQTITPGTTTEANGFDLFVPSSVGNNTLTLTAGAFRHVTFSNAAYTVANTALNFYGDVIIGATPTFTAGANTWSFISTGTTVQKLTTNGRVINWPLTKSGGTTSTLQLQDSLTVNSTRLVSHSHGILDLQSYTLTSGNFSSSFSTVRTIAFGTGKIVIPGSAQYSTSTSTNFSSTGSKLVEAILSASTTTVIASGTTTENASVDVQVIQTGNGTLNISGNFRNLTFPNSAYTVQNQALTIYGDVLINGSTPTFNAGANIWTFAATESVVQNVTSGGKTFDFPITKAGSTTSTLRLQDALTIGAARTLTLTNGIIDLQSYTLTCGFFSSSNSNVRSIAFNTGKLVLSGTSSTVMNMATATNFTATGSKLVEALPLAGTRTYSFGSTTEANTLNFSIPSGGTVSAALTVTGNINNFSANGPCSFTTTFAPTVFGDFYLIGTDVLWNGGGTVNTTFASTSGIKNITTNGVVMECNVIFNGVGGTWQLQSALTIGVSKLMTLTAGAFDMNGYSVSTGRFTVTGNALVRSINFGSNEILITDNTGYSNPVFYNSLVLTGTLINYSVSGLNQFGIATTANTVILNVNATNYDLLPSIRVANNSTNLHFNNGSNINNLILSEGAVQIRPLNQTQESINIYGNLLAESTWTGSFGVTGDSNFNPPFYYNQLVMKSTSGVKTITSNGKTINAIIKFSSAAGSWRFEDAYQQSVQNDQDFARWMELQEGTLDFNGYNISVNSFRKLSTTATLIFGSSQLIIIGDDNAYPPAGSTYGPCYIDFNNLTLNRGTGRIVFQASGQSSFLGGGSGDFLNTISPPIRNNGTGNGVVIRTINSRLVVGDLLPHPTNGTYFFFPFASTTYFDKFTLTPPVGIRAYLQSASGAGNTYYFVLTNGIANCQRLNIADCHATPSTNTWYAGSTSIAEGTNVQGWIFADAPVGSTGNMFLLFT